MSEPDTVVITPRPRRSPVDVAQGVLSAAWLFCISGVFLITWISPYALDERMVYNLCFVMLIEFFVVHATGFFGASSTASESTLKRAGMYAGLMLFYCVFALAFSAAYGGLFPLYALLGLLLPKMGGVVFQPPDEVAQFRIMAQWAGMTLIYLFAVIGTVAVPVPALGITPEVITSQEFTMTGAWPEEPYRVLAAGTIYFFGLGVLTIVSVLYPVSASLMPRPAVTRAR